MTHHHLMAKGLIYVRFFIIYINKILSSQMQYRQFISDSQSLIQTSHKIILLTKN